MAFLDSEGVQLVIEMAVVGVIGVIGVWYLNRRTRKRESEKGGGPA
ncbi:MAG: hypothetical protein ABI347_06815 [Nitrososphaera sp.]|jgi:hypothetical protein